MVATLSETARAKINLTLQVLGRRDDGFHELVSLVAFAEIGDVVELEPDGTLGLSIDGPFAAREQIISGHRHVPRARSASAARHFFFSRSDFICMPSRR